MLCNQILFINLFTVTHKFRFFLSLKAVCFPTTPPHQINSSYTCYLSLHFCLLRLQFSGWWRWRAAWTHLWASWSFGCSNSREACCWNTIWTWFWQTDASKENSRFFWWLEDEDCTCTRSVYKPNHPVAWWAHQSSWLVFLVWNIWYFYNFWMRSWYDWLLHSSIWDYLFIVHVFYMAWEIRICFS